MRRQPHPVIGLSGGLDVSADPVFLTDQKSPNLREVYYHKRMLKKEFGFHVFGSGRVLPERPMMFAPYRQLDGDLYLVTLTVDKAYEYDATNDEWDFITDSDVWTGDEDDRFDSCVMNDLFLVTNGKDAVQKWTGAA